MKEVIKITPLQNYRLELVFNDGKKKIKDMNPYLEKGIFKKLKNTAFFNSAKIMYGAVSWNGEIELCADSLYETSEEIKE